jgi:hypothetical protein
MSWDNDSDSSDFFFAGSSSGSDSLTPAGAVVLLIILVVVLGLVVWSNKVGKEDDRKVLTYIDGHQCKIDSFMGGDRKKRAVYQCADGRMLDFELREKALK